jgi:hypothetical protein
MTTTNRDLAAEAQRMAKGSGGLRRTALMTCVVALGTTRSVRAAAAAIEELVPQPDVRRAALEVLDELAGEREAVR